MTIGLDDETICQASKLLRRIERLEGGRASASTAPFHALLDGFGTAAGDALTEELRPAVIAKYDSEIAVARRELGGLTAKPSVAADSADSLGLTPETVAAAIRSEFADYYSEPMNPYRGERPPETDVGNLVDGVLRRLFGGLKDEPGAEDRFKGILK